jgi:hypothetical protein
MKKAVILLAMVCFIVVFSGCAGISLTKEARSSLKTVCVCPDVPKPDKIGVHGAGETFAEMAGFLTLGVAGAIAASEIPKKRGPLLKYVMEKEGIDPSEIMREQFTKKLQQAALFPIVEGKGDAEFKLVIQGISFSKPPGFTSNLQPCIYVQATLVKPDGTILWKNREWVAEGASGTPRRKYKEYVGDPKLLREAIEIASGIVAGKLVKDLGK